KKEAQKEDDEVAWRGTNGIEKVRSVLGALHKNAEEKEEAQKPISVKRKKVRKEEAEEEGEEGLTERRKGIVGSIKDIFGIE
ncbi:MAG: hypothetical protein QXK65_01645, partial [Candidatus Micrarchaeaceae archaeon]